MYVDNEDVFYYLTIYNENYDQPAKPCRRGRTGHPGSRASTVGSDRPRGASGKGDRSCSPVRHTSPAREAQAELAERWGVGVDLWSATSYKRLREQAMEIERWNRLHPEAEPRDSPRHLGCCRRAQGRSIAVSDYIRSGARADHPVRAEPSFTALGTDGYGRSDDREALRVVLRDGRRRTWSSTVLTELARTTVIDRPPAS